MALVVGELAAKLELERGGFDRGLEQARSSLENLSSSMTRFGGIMSAAVTAPVAALGAKAFEAYGQQEKAETALRATLEATGQAADGVVDKLKNYASALQQQTVYGDEAILNGMALAANLGVQAKDLEAAAQAAVGLASAYGLDITTAFQLVGKAAEGNVAGLQRLGIQFDENATAQEKFAQVLQLGAGKMAIARAEAETSSGKFQQMKNSIGDAMESLGAALAPAIEKIAGMIKRLADIFTSLPAPVQSGIALFATLAAAIGPAAMAIGAVVKAFTAIQTLAPLLGASWGIAFGPVAGIIGTIALLAGAAYMLVKHWDKVKSFFSTLWDGIKKGLDWLVNAVKSAWDAIAKNLEGLKGIFSRIWDFIYEVTIGRFVRIFGFLKRLIETLLKIGGDLMAGKSVDFKSAANYVFRGGGEEDTKLLRDIRDALKNQSREKPVPATRIS